MADFETMRWVYRTVLITATVASWAVVFTYHFRSGGLWRQSAWGRHLIGSDTLLATILTFYIFASFLPREVTYGVGVGLFIIYIWFRLSRSRLMMHSQDEGERLEEEQTEAAAALARSREERGTS